MNAEKLLNFLDESNTIEGIYRLVKADEQIEATRFLALNAITIPDLERFVECFQPDAKLRDKPGMDVRVGNHVPPKGGPEIREHLGYILKLMEKEQVGKYFSPEYIHQKYETLHPFMDCNGRSGRILWLWQMERDERKMAPMGFLQTWYYQSLEDGR